MCINRLVCWGVSLPLFSVEESKDVFAGHESLLNISQFQVIHGQHILLLLLLKKGISNKSLAAPRESSVQSAERRPSAMQAPRHQGGTGKHSQLRLGTADKFSCYPSVIQIELHTSTTQKASLWPELPQPHLPTLKSQPKSSSIHDTAPRVACFKPHPLHLPKLLVRKCLVLEHHFPMSPHKQTSHTLLQHLIRDHQHWGHASPIPKTHEQDTACSVLHHNCSARMALSMRPLTTPSQSYAAFTVPLLPSQYFFFFKVTKNPCSGSRKARHVIKKLFWHTLGTIST